MKVLIIEDDPMVAMIHQEFLNQLPHRIVIKHVKTLEAVPQILVSFRPDLILMDNYLPDGIGVSYLNSLKEYPIIMITAANDTDTVKQAISSGVIDYLVKPFTFERFEQAITRALGYTSILEKDKLNQDHIDQYFRPVQEDVTIQRDLPKGLSKITLKKIVEKVLEQSDNFTTQQLASGMTISRITIKKYLNYLVQKEWIKEDMMYLSVGRPVYAYRKIDVAQLEKFVKE